MKKGENKFSEADNILDSVPQIIFKYPKDTSVINIIHIYQGLHIGFKTTPWDIDYIDVKRGESFKTLEDSIAEFKKQGYEEIVKKYGNTNALNSFGTLLQKFVPNAGPASTLEGEMLRAIAKIEYRFGNDGDMVGSGSPSVDIPYMFLKEISGRFRYD